ncbi:tRNA pseudouridine38-40 synthase [Prevotella sp. KH2C16]|nr:tRNA pseudouridine38-40 synthase [Prevotella sp. KH2C16]
MMQRYFIYLSYDGTRYHGWQVQPNGISVQGELQSCLSVLLRKPVEITGAGRTDAGVHARMMVAHFDVDDVFDETQLVYRLNRMLPRDIAVGRIEKVASDLHARFSATARTYYYFIHIGRDPFLRHYSLEMPYQLDFDKMSEAARQLLTVKDFGAFCKAGADVKTTLCDVTRAQWELMEDGDVKRWRFVITANRFLRNMVRAVVGTLIDVGRGKISIGEFRQIIASGSRSSAGESMPGHALFLWDIKY